MIIVEESQGGMTHTSAFVGPTNHTVHHYVKVSSLTVQEVDVDGRLKPNLPLKENGEKCNGTANEFVYGVTVEATQIVAKNPTDASLAADMRKVPVAVATQGQINRSIARDTLGRAYTPAEIAAFKAAGSGITLTLANI